MTASALPGGQPAPVPAPGLPGREEGDSPGTLPNEPSRSAGIVKGAPWHFKLLVVGVTVYMIYRIYWLAEWLPKHI